MNPINRLASLILFVIAAPFVILACAWASMLIGAAAMWVLQ